MPPSTILCVRASDMGDITDGDSWILVHDYIHGLMERTGGGRQPLPWQTLSRRRSALGIANRPAGVFLSRLQP